ncbi:MAG: hypothetical protein ABI360_04585 [Allobranchiibius sp.]
MRLFFGMSSFPAGSRTATVIATGAVDAMPGFETATLGPGS